jgi:hypothetical protein
MSTEYYLEPDLAQELGTALQSYAHWLAIFERLQELKTEDAPPDAHEAAHAEAFVAASPATRQALALLARALSEHKPQGPEEGNKS